MDSTKYLRVRRRYCLNMAEQFSKKAIDSIEPVTAARWVRLMDAALWLATDDGEADYLDHMCKKDEAA